jgi:ethanolamine ammonia-lyase small subunit
LSCIPQQLYVGHPGHDERTLMSDAEQRHVAEALFAPKQSREEIKEAIKLEEARRAAMVKNLYRLRSLRLSRNQAGTRSKNSTFSD